MNRPISMVLFAVLFAVVGAAPAAERTAVSPFTDGAGAAKRYTAAGWKLIWADEFDQAGAPDPAKWDYERGRVRNREAQFYTVDRRENARVENGQLIISARREPWSGAEFTSASVVSRGKFSFRYGKLEIRTKIPTGRGTWPALWMLGDSKKGVGWPRCGEIDLMENVGYEPDKVHFTVHTGAFNHVKKTGVGRAITVPRAHEKFHTYGLLWTAERLEFFMDGKKVHEFVNDGQGVDHWPFDAPCHLLMNLAIGRRMGRAQGHRRGDLPGGVSDRLRPGVAEVRGISGICISSRVLKIPQKRPRKHVGTRWHILADVLPLALPLI